MSRRCFASLIVFLFAALSCSAQQTLEKDSPWSLRIAQSFLMMHPDSVTYSNNPASAKWDYELGLMLEALFRMWEHTKDSQYVKYIRKNLEYYIQNDGSIRTYRLDEFNIDRVAPGKPTLRMYQMFGDLKFKKAADTFRRQLREHPRTSEGGFWHKKIYPYQMWLDGLYMGHPFYTLYAGEFHEQAAFDDIAKQFLLIEQHSYDARTELYYHGWDESKEQKWADKKTGLSPNLWGRAIGWFSMALVDVLEYFPEDHPNRKDLLRILSNLATNVLKHRDEKTKLWYQVVDKPGADGNYLEASASAMFTYAFAKGARLRYLPKEFGDHAAESFRGILGRLVTVGDDGVVHLHHVCQVAGLGGNP